MISHKHVNCIVWIAVAAAVLFCVGAMLLAPKLLETADLGVRMEYEKRIFDTSEPVVINILMDPDEWQNMLDTATQEIYHQCDVVINGVKFQGVGIRPKGNTSLSNIAMNANTDRYSFKLEFDQFVDGQTAWGLDKLCLNNNYADATNMKEALVYDMFQFLGADASLYNHAVIYVNGEYWGIYLALEAVEESFMLRNYGVTNGELYKPDSMGLSRDDDEGWGASDGDRQDDGDEGWGPSGGDRQEDGDEGWGASDGRRRDASEEPEPDPMPPEGELSETMQAIVNEREAESASEETDGSGEASGESGWDREDDRDNGGGFGPFGGGGGQNLNYIDDDLDSYTTIWRCEVTRTSEADHRRVVTALKNISEGVNLEESMDIDNLLRLMAVHNFSVNGDSLSGGMAHNYYLYESDGRLNVLPWDYNLAFGGMGMGGNSAKSVVNEPIDDSWQSTRFFDPLLENEEYLAKYHEYYRQLVEEYILGGKFDEFYERTRAQIDDLVATDPNALYDFDEYDAGAETLHQLVDLRGESILGQLNGTIPSTSQGQRQDSSALIEAENVNISLMGTMGMGGSFGGGGGWEDGENPFRDRRASGEAEESSASGEAEEDSASGEAGEDAASGATEISEATSGEAVSENAASGEARVSENAEEAGASAEPAAEASTENNTEESTADDSEEIDEEMMPAESAQSSEEPASATEAGEVSGEAEDSSRESSRRSRSASGEMRRGLDGKSIALLVACGVVLAGGLVAAILLKKKR